MEQLTRQGVRNLDTLPAKPVWSRPYVEVSIDERCKHPSKQPCVRACCGDFYCPDCGLAWDE